MKQIIVLLTKYSDWISTLIYHVSGRGYTHSSIALEENPGRYYSFNYRGFVIETVDKHRRRGVRKSCCIQLQVSDETYDRIQGRIGEVLAHRQEYSYTRLGVFCCLFRLPFRWKKHYFCSQFVAELLVESGAVSLRKRPCLYFPNEFAELAYLPACRRVLLDIV